MLSLLLLLLLLLSMAGASAKAVPGWGSGHEPNKSGPSRGRCCAGWALQRSNPRPLPAEGDRYEDGDVNASQTRRTPFACGPCAHPGGQQSSSPPRATAAVATRGCLRRATLRTVNACDYLEPSLELPPCMDRLGTWGWGKASPFQSRHEPGAPCHRVSSKSGSHPSSSASDDTSNSSLNSMPRTSWCSIIACLTGSATTQQLQLPPSSQPEGLFHFLRKLMPQWSLLQQSRLPTSRGVSFVRFPYR